jgi:glyoxylase-like metal-dependent hydrolase (beta-lactamase superfamily II)
MRRLLFLVCAAAASLAATTAAQAPAPAAAAQAPFETRKVDGTDNVYIFRYGGAQSMFVVTPDGVIATDPVGYGRTDRGQVYLAEIRKVTNAPIRYVIYSHQHIDHTAGGQALKEAGATFIAHRNAKARLERLRDPNTVIPDEVMDRSRTIRLGGTALELAYVGLNHSDSTLVMRLPRERILFAVDFLNGGAIGGRGFIDSYPVEWEQSIEQVLKMDWDKLIPGHPGPGGRLGTRKDAEDMLAFLRYASAEVKPLAQSGQCWDGVENTVKLERYATYPGVDAALPFVLRRYCGLWGRGF